MVQKLIVPLVFGIVFVERRREAGLHIFTAEAKACPAEIDVGTLVRTGRDAQRGLVPADAALNDLDLRAGIGGLEVGCDLLERDIGGVVVEVEVQSVRSSAFRLVAVIASTDSVARSVVFIVIKPSLERSSPLMVTPENSCDCQYLFRTRTKSIAFPLSFVSA